MSEKATPNMLDYIGDKMDTLDFDGDLDLNWDKEAHVIEVEITMYTDATSDYEVEDQNGQKLEDGQEVDYSDAILFYDQTRLDGTKYAKNYLAIFGFNGKEGISQAKVDALFSYLQPLLDDGQEALYDFVDGKSADETFELNFDQKKYDAALEDTSYRQQQTMLAYPKF